MIIRPFRQLGPSPVSTIRFALAEAARHRRGRVIRGILMSSFVALDFVAGQAGLAVVDSLTFGSIAVHRSAGGFSLTSDSFQAGGSFDFTIADPFINQCAPCPAGTTISRGIGVEGAYLSSGGLTINGVTYQWTGEVPPPPPGHRANIQFSTSADPFILPPVDGRTTLTVVVPFIIGGGFSTDTGIFGTFSGSGVLAQLGGWFDDYNTLAPHSALGMRSPREHRALASGTPPHLPQDRRSTEGPLSGYPPKLGIERTRASS